MMRTDTIYILFVTLFCFTSCATNEGMVTKSTTDDYEITTIQIRGAAFSTPIKTKDNVVVLGTHKRSIYFLTPDSIKNAFRTKLWVHATPAIVYDSLIAIGSYDGNLYFFNQEGVLQDKLRKCGRIYTNPVQVNSDWISFATGFRGLWLYNKNTDSLHLSKLKKLTHGSPTMLNNGEICIGSNDGIMYFFDKQGNIQNKFKTNGWIMHSKPYPLSDSTIVFGSYDHHLYAITATGHELWEFPTQGKIHASPQQFADGNIICGSFDGNIYIVDNNGKQVGVVKTDRDVISSAAIYNDTNAVVGSFDKFLYFIDSKGNLQQKIFLDGEIFSSPIVLDDGTIFCATTNGKAVFIKKKE